MTDAGEAISGSRESAPAELASKLEALSLPEAYDVPTRHVHCIETHFACVFLTDTHVYKLKKPIRAPGLELDSPARRHANCEEELRLNRELAPDVYIGLVPLTRESDGTLRVGGTGPAVDCLVKMLRLPADRMLDQAIATGTVDMQQLDAVIERLIAFYRRQPPIVLDGPAGVQRLAGQVAANRTELLEPDLLLDAGRVQSVIAAQQRALGRVGAEIGARAASGCMREVHGDLRPEHLCLAPPAIIDRLEFSRELRIMDPCEDLAYLAVECTRAGAAWIGDHVFARYQAATADAASAGLLRFYRSHRAATRAKVVAWHVRDAAFRDREPWPLLADRYLADALGVLEPAR